VSSLDEASPPLIPPSFKERGKILKRGAKPLFYNQTVAQRNTLAIKLTNELKSQ